VGVSGKAGHFADPRSLYFSPAGTYRGNVYCRNGSPPPRGGIEVITADEMCESCSVEQEGNEY